MTLDSRSHDATYGWFALGAFARIEALVGEVVAFQLDGGVTVPLEHGGFRASPSDSLAFRVPAFPAPFRDSLTTKRPTAS